MSALSQEHSVSASHMLPSFLRCPGVPGGNAVSGHRKGAGGFSGGRVSIHGERKDKNPGHRDSWRDAGSKDGGGSRRRQWPSSVRMACQRLQGLIKSSFGKQKTFLTIPTLLEAKAPVQKHKA